MKKSIKKGFTHSLPATVNPTYTRGRIATSCNNSITQFVGKVKKNFAEFGKGALDFLLIGKRYRLVGDSEYEIAARGGIRMKRFKRVLLCALLALCIAGAVVSAIGVVGIFKGVFL